MPPQATQISWSVAAEPQPWEVTLQATDVSHLSLREAAALIQARSVSPPELTEE